MEQYHYCEPRILLAYLLLKPPFSPQCFRHFWQTSMCWLVHLFSTQNEWISHLSLAWVSIHLLIQHCLLLLYTISPPLFAGFFVLFHLRISKDTCREMRLCQFPHLVPAQSQSAGYSLFCDLWIRFVSRCLQYFVFHAQSGKVLCSSPQNYCWYARLTQNRKLLFLSDVNLGSSMAPLPNNTSCTQCPKSLSLCNILWWS